jgi:hypothetical protein
VGDEEASAEGDCEQRLGGGFAAALLGFLVFWFVGVLVFWFGASGFEPSAGLMLPVALGVSTLRGR